MIEIVGSLIENPLVGELPRYVRYATELQAPQPFGLNLGGITEAVSGTPREATRLILAHLSDTALGPLDWPEES